MVHATESATCNVGPRDWIEIRFDSSGSPGGSLEPELQRRVVEHLRAEFVHEGIEVCPAAHTSEKPPLARLRIEGDASNSTVLRAWANDAVTEKDVSRKLSLVGLPEDAHAMAIALGASELLKASWAELRLASFEGRANLAPAAVQRVVGSSGAENTNGSMSFSAAAESFAGGVRQFGLDAELAVRLSRNLALTVRVGGRSSLSAASRHGSVAVDGWLLGLGADYELLRPAERWRLLLQSRGDAMWATFSGIAKKGATATSEAAVAAWLTAGIGVEGRVGKVVALEAGFAAGGVLLPLSASDDGMVVIGLSKGLVAGHAGVKIVF